MISCVNIIFPRESIPRRLNLISHTTGCSLSPLRCPTLPDPAPVPLKLSHSNFPEPKLKKENSLLTVPRLQIKFGKNSDSAFSFITHFTAKIYFQGMTVYPGDESPETKKSRKYPFCPKNQEESLKIYLYETFAKTNRPSRDSGFSEIF